MEVWSWIIGYAVLFAIVQLAIYAYYVRQGEGAPSPSAAGDGDDYARVGDHLDRDPIAETALDDPAPAADPEEEMRACPHCGTPNETVGTVRYCRNCTRSLG